MKLLLVCWPKWDNRDSGQRYGQALESTTLVVTCGECKPFRVERHDV